MSVLRPRVRSFCSCSAPRTSRSDPSVLTSAQRQRSPAKVLQSSAPKRVRVIKPIVLPAGVPRTELFLDLADRGVAAIARRPTLVNEDAARDLVREWGVDKMHDAVVVEPFAGQSLVRRPFARRLTLARAAGPGGITRALLELKNVKRVISIEDSLRYNHHLRVRTFVLLQPAPTPLIAWSSRRCRANRTTPPASRSSTTTPSHGRPTPRLRIEGFSTMCQNSPGMKVRVTPAASDGR